MRVVSDMDFANPYARFVAAPFRAAQKSGMREPTRPVCFLRHNVAYGVDSAWSRCLWHASAQSAGPAGQRMAITDETRRAGP